MFLSGGIHDLRLYILRVLSVLLPLPCLEIPNSRGECFQGFVVIIIKRHFLLDQTTISFADGLHDFHFEVGRGESIVVFIQNVEHKLWSVSAKGDPGDIGIRDLPFDPDVRYEA